MKPSFCPEEPQFRTYVPDIEFRLRFQNGGGFARGRTFSIRDGEVHAVGRQGLRHRNFASMGSTKRSSHSGFSNPRHQIGQ